MPVNKRLTIGIAATALAATVSLVAAGPFRHERAHPAHELVSPEQIVSSVRALGFSPSTQPIRRGSYYVLHAFDARGILVRIVADAALGDVVSVTQVVAPRYDFGPRIIHVPQPGDTVQEPPVLYERGEAYDQPPSGDRITPPRRVENAPSQPVDSAPPLSPIYPTPKFGNRK